MIEAAVAVHLWLQQPSSLIEPARASRTLKRRGRPLLKPAPSHSNVEMIEVRIEDPTFAQAWQYRVCLPTASWVTDDTLQCTW